MDNKVLLEDIKRMHELIGIKPNILIESVITEQVRVATIEAAQLLAKFFTNLERAVVAGGKSYTKNEVKQIIGKIGTIQLSNEEKLVVSTLTKEAIALDKTLLKRLSGEIFGEMQKLSSRRLKSLYYTKVKRGLKEVLPKEELADLITKVDAKLGVKPKPAPRPTVTPTPTTPPPNTGQGSGGFVDTPDDELLAMLKQEMTKYNIKFKLNPKQQEFFINEIKPKIHELYTKEEKNLATGFMKVKDRYDQLGTLERIELIKTVQKNILEAGIGLNIPRKILYDLGKFFAESLKKNRENGKKYFLTNLKIQGITYFFDILATKIKTGEYGISNNLFDLSWEKNVGIKGVLALVGQFFMGIPGKIINFAQLGASGANFYDAFKTKDAKFELGDSPISIQDAKDFVENEKNPLGLDFKVDKLIYIPFNVKGEKMEGDRGATIKVYIIDQLTKENTYQTTLIKDHLTRIVSQKP